MDRSRRRRERCCAKSSSCGTCPNTRRTTAGTSSAGFRRKPTARRSDWYAQTIEREKGVSVPALGPYPERGEYEHCFTLEGPRGEFVQLTPSVAEYVARAIEFGKLAGSAERRQAIDDRERRAEREYDSWAFDTLL